MTRRLRVWWRTRRETTACALCGRHLPARAAHHIITIPSDRLELSLRGEFGGGTYIAADTCAAHCPGEGCQRRRCPKRATMTP